MSSRLEVLVVDDSAMNRKMMVRLLKMSNICDSPFQAGNGSDAVNIVIDTLSAQSKRRKKIKKNSQVEECNVEDGTGAGAGDGTNGSTGAMESPVFGDCNEGAVMSSVPDVILLDYLMPIMNGPEATKLMREAGYVGLIIGETYIPLLLILCI
jgi:CheY-like chemotaxis protein